MVSHAKNESVIGQVVEWNKNWLMMDGFVACSTCLEFQSIEYMGEPFKHAGNCTKGNDGEESPWRTLETILNWSANQGGGLIKPSLVTSVPPDPCS